MKAPVLIVIVILTHVVVIGSVLCMQGCRTKSVGMVEPPPTPVLPPEPVEPVTAPAYPALQPPAPVEPAPAMAPPLEGQTYKVQRGDSLSKIAARAGVTVRELVELNNIKNPDRIRVGQTIVLPDHAKPLPAGKPSTSPARKAAEKKATVKLPEGGTVYVVVAGDNLSKIAARHGVKLADLRAANNLKGDKILVGQKLVIPGPAKARMEKATSLEARPPQVPPAAPMAPQPAPEVIGPSSAAAPVSAVPETSTAAPPPASTTSVAAEPQVYRAQENETVESVAKLFVVDINELMALNGFTDPQQKLNPGQKVLIPFVSQP